MQFRIYSIAVMYDPCELRWRLEQQREELSFGESEQEYAGQP